MLVYWLVTFIHFSTKGKSTMQKCEACRGTGLVSRGVFRQKKRCKACAGSGEKSLGKVPNKRYSALVDGKPHSSSHHK